ncbi:MAG: hypothetical protein GQ531_11445 [Sulfurovum sp.]|nr:hypothetical protein [Sulfurovum sp.]
MTVLSVVAVLGLSACGGGGSDYYDDGYYPPVEPIDPLITLFIVDELNNRINDIEYVCDSTRGFTGDRGLAGEFSFRDFDDCTFYLDDYIVLGDDLFIVDVYDVGKNNIPYTCDSDNLLWYTGDSGRDGEFEYSYFSDDVCTFEF